jgi:hypothetical protein
LVPKLAIANQLVWRAGIIDFTCANLCVHIASCQGCGHIFVKSFSSNIQGRECIMVEKCVSLLQAYCTLEGSSSC